MTLSIKKEGSLEAPIRHAVDWQTASFYDATALENEMERVFDACHGCRRCVNLCQAFPVLFDLVDESETLEVDGIAKADYQKVVDQCYLCDLCYMTKCPYVPPHEWGIDFPHLMLRAKAVVFKKTGAKHAHQLLASPQKIGWLVSHSRLSNVVNWLNRRAFVRGVLAKVLDVHRKAKIPKYHNQTASRLFKQTKQTAKNKVAIFATCYGEYNAPQIVNDLASVLKHNDVAVTLVEKTQCCGMPKLELGDIESAVNYAKANKKALLAMVDKGYRLIAPIPSCVLMFKNELPMLLPQDEDIKKIANAFYDPFEYLDMLLADNALKTDFKSEKIQALYQVACHQRVQNIGAKTKKILKLIPNIELTVVERCSGHDGTYGVKNSSYEFAVKIAKPVARQLTPQTDYLLSDCVMAANHIAHVAGDETKAIHPISLLKQCYGISTKDVEAH